MKSPDNVNKNKRQKAGIRFLNSEYFIKQI